MESTVSEATVKANVEANAISTGIDKWVNWKAKNDSSITLTRTDGNLLHFQVDAKKFTVTCPKDYPNDGSLLMIESEDSISWINRVMNFIIRKNPSIFTLLKFIEKEHKNERAKRSDEIDIVDLPSLHDEELMLTRFDLEEAKYEKRLKEQLPKMKSSLVSDANTKAQEIFKGDVPGHILINMLMSTRKRYFNNDKISVSLINDNVYNWLVTFNRFGNNEINTSMARVKSMYGYDSIQVNIMFHDKMFPSYPPFIKLLRPRMMDSLMHRISNLKMVQFDYWTPSRTMIYIIDKLYEIFDKHAVIDTDSDMNDIVKYPNGSYHELEGVLVKLASLCDVGNQYEELDTTEYKRTHAAPVKLKSTMKSTSSTKTSSKNTGIWAAGTGYGYSGSSAWDLKEYVQLQQERDLQIQSILQRITEVLMSMQPTEASSVYKILESSYLIPYIKTLFKETTMVEIDKHNSLYKLVFTLLQFLITEEAIYLFDDSHGDRNLFQILSDMNSEAMTVKMITDGDGKASDDSELDITSMIMSLFEFANSCYVPYYENKLKNQAEQVQQKAKEDEEKRTTEEKLKDAYVEEMSKHRFAICKFASNGFHYKYAPSNDKIMLRAIGKECSSFTKSLPIHYGSSVLARVDSTNSRCMRVMITGPNGTPYDSGVFIFDAYMPDKWPNVNPQMHFENHGGVRFNPNLYNCGKVCLSLLGTWRGEASENWNPTTSTLSQLFISVQSQILIDDPYYNEPGHERSYGTDSGIKASKLYNNYIRQFTMQHAMVGVIDTVLKGGYPEFKEPVLTHFKLKKAYILDVCQKWVNDAFDATSSAQHSFSMTKDKYKETFAKLKEYLDKL